MLIEKKFRVWDGKKYHYPECDQDESNHFLQFGSNGVFFLHNSEGEFISGSKKAGIIEQLLGVDEMNTNIYEGDIVQHEITVENYDEDDEWNPRNYNRSRFSTVRIKNQIKFNISSLVLITDQKIKVIGNIHQNPELLK